MAAPVGAARDLPGAVAAVSVDKLQIPLLVHIADNDKDVNIEEGMQLVDALRARKPTLAETKVYENPPGGHMFDRRVNPTTWEPENTPEQRDSWNRVWAFLDRKLEPPLTPAAVRAARVDRPGTRLTMKVPSRAAHVGQ